MAERPLKILLLAAEVVPFAKTGGMADVTGSLPKALRALGHDVRVAMPRYGRVRPERFHLERLLTEFPVPIHEGARPASLWQTTLEGGTPVYFVENAPYFEREGIYMYPDDAERFIFFCRAALEATRHLNWQPDIVHCHDWHTALVPNWLETLYADDPHFAGTAGVYTIHNLAYRGIFGHRVLEIAGIDEYGFLAHPDKPEEREIVDFMARGIYFSDVISTVSPTYAREILTPEQGEGLEKLLYDRRDHLYGIVNGIDVDHYNPATDAQIEATFDVDHRQARQANKLALQHEAGLTPDPEKPLLGIISRLTEQKGIGLLTAMAEPILHHLDAQLVIMGTGEQHYHDFFGNLLARFPGQAGVFLTFNDRLARMIFAGSDMYLMPSRFEPCGLNQMIAMRYGSVPVVRAAGGLADTVASFDPRSGVGTGFVFEAYDALAFYTAVVRAVETYRNPYQWQILQGRCMTTDVSWSAPAREYEKLYRQALLASREARVLPEYEYYRR
ncbi:MAG: glycogen synthase [Anaerolineae bacterium]